VLPLEYEAEEETHQECFSQSFEVGTERVALSVAQVTIG